MPFSLPKMTIQDKSAFFHTIRFYKPDVKAIHNISLQPDYFNQLAVSRSDASIEVWDVQHYPYLQHFFSSVANSSVEDLKWCGNRLFSCGLQGTVVEYDFFNRVIKSSTAVTGGVAWCLDYSPQNNLIAVGTEDGFINIFTVTEDSLEYLKLLDKQQGRVLCMTWDKTGQFLVTGSLDVVRVWNIASGHAVHKMTTGRSQSKKETIVWSIAVSSDFTIISGDSRGVLTFWDGKLGVQIENFRSHEADILSVALTPDEKRVVCAGVDPVIAVYGRVIDTSSKRQRQRQWARGGLYRMHEHDVRAISIARDGRVFSGGVSGYLTVTATSPKIRLKYPPVLMGECMQVVSEKRQMMLRYLDRLELWRLGDAIAGTDSSYSQLPLAHNPSCLLRINAESGQSINMAAISDDGQYLVYSTQHSLHLFSFNLEDKLLVKIQTPSECGPCKLFAFSIRDNRQYCIAVTNLNKVSQLEFSDNGVDESHVFLPSATSCVTDSISHVSLSPCGELMALADCSSHVAVWSLLNWSLVASLPTYPAVPTALAFPNNRSLVVAYSDHKVVEFDVRERKYSEFSKRLGQLQFDGVFHSAITGIFFDPRRTTSMILHDDSTILTVLIDKVIENGTIPKKKLKNNNSNSKVNPSESAKLCQTLAIKKFKHILSAHWLEKDEVVLLELTPSAITDSLPPALLKKKFGT